MRVWMLCMATGIGAVAWVPHLLPAWQCGLLLLPWLLGWRLFRHRAYLPSLALIIGVLWGIGYGHFIRAGLLPIDLEQQSLLLTGTIDGLVEQAQGFQQQPVQRFQLRVERCQRIPDDVCPANLRNVRLSWYDTTLQPSGGERWQLQVKLKRPRGFANPGGFDYEAWLVAQRIGAVGYVERSVDNHRIDVAAPWSVDYWRSRMQRYLDTRLRNAAHRDLLAGLLVGDGSAIEQHTWDTFRATGTVHLFVVSGLQIAFTGGLMLWCSRLWWRSPWAQSRRWHYALGVLPALVAATLYALLAGIGLPMQRSLIMFALLAWALVSWREIRADAWTLALLLVLLADPLAVLDVGFWFSFLAVGAILVSVCGRRSQFIASSWSRWWLWCGKWCGEWWRVQCAIFVTSLPVLLAMSGQFTLLAMPANIIAVPWSTIITMPLAFLALIADAFAPQLGTPLWWLADQSLEWLWRYLLLLQQWGRAGIWQAQGITAFSLLFAALVALLWLLPRGVPGRPLAALFLLPLWWPQLDAVAPGTCRVTVIDVGQGLSVLVETHAHTLLYDTGPLFGPERTVAELAIAPLLRQRGISALDTLIVSHKDSDHAGGWRALHEQFGVRRFLVGEALGAADETFCKNSQWHWDDVEFDILRADTAALAVGNDRSCVLQINVGATTLLLSGDIERAGEEALLTNARLHTATLLLAPHHGSKTSSSATFIERVQPRYVIFSTGYLNRFHHPSPLVVERYRQAGATPFDTAESGALTFVLQRDGVAQITKQRDLNPRYWQ